MSACPDGKKKPGRPYSGPLPAVSAVVRRGFRRRYAVAHEVMRWDLEDPSHGVELRGPRLALADLPAADRVAYQLEAGHLEILPDALAFYQRLLEKSDDELERGRLPRDEVEESLSELRRR